MKKKRLEIGQEVFIIEKDLNIVPKKIVGFKEENGELKYQLNVNYCSGISKEDFFMTNRKAQVTKQKFLNRLRFKVGDLIVFEYKHYGRKDTDIGRVDKIIYSEKNPYVVKTTYNEIRDISDDDKVLKLKEDYIENFGLLKELYDEFEEKNTEINKILSKLNKEHERLEKELQKSFKKQYSWIHWDKSKPLFKDRFNYERDYDD